MLFGDKIIVHQTVSNLALGFSVVIISAIGTVNHPNMHLNETEIMEASESARYVLLLELFIILSLSALGASDRYVCYMSWGIMMCALSIVAAKLSKQEVKNER